MQLPSRLVAGPARPRRRIWPAVALALGLGILGAGVVVTPTPAYADVSTADYTIGTPTNSVSHVAASPSTLVQGAATSFKVQFQATSALSGGAGSTISIVSSANLTSPPGDVSLVDNTAPACLQGGTGGGAASASGVTVDLGSACAINAGDLVEVDFTAAGPATTGDLYFTVTTSGNATPAVSNTLTIGTIPPTFSATSVVLGANATYALSDVAWTDLSQDLTALVLTAKAASGKTISWYDGASGYAVTYTPPLGTPATDAVASVALSTTTYAGDTVTLTLTTPLAANDALDITGKGTNPATTSSDEVTISPVAGPAASLGAVGAPDTTTNSLVFGTLVSGVVVAPSPAVASASATYVVHFEATTKLTGGSGAEICLDEPDGPTLFSSQSGTLVSDTTAGWQFIAASLTFPTGNPPSNPGCGGADNGAVITLPAGYNVSSGDSITLTVVGVTNPGAGTVADFSVATSADTVAADAGPYAIGAGGRPGVAVSVARAPRVPWPRTPFPIFMRWRR